MTGKDTVGGLQLQIIPEYDVGSIQYSNMQNTVLSDKDWISYVDPVPKGAQCYDSLKTPRELLLKDGDVIHIKNMAKLQPSRKKQVVDLLVESPVPLNLADPIELELYYDLPSEMLFKVQELDGQKPPESFKVCVTGIFQITTWLT
jgi:hypothetical protein